MNVTAAAAVTHHDLANERHSSCEAHQPVHRDRSEHAEYVGDLEGERHRRGQLDDRHDWKLRPLQSAELAAEPRVVVVSATAVADPGKTANASVTLK